MRNFALTVAIVVTFGSSAFAGVVGGPERDIDVLGPRQTFVYTMLFRAHEVVQVVVIGDGSTDLDLVVVDEYGNRIAADMDYTDDCIVRFVPSWTGVFRVKIINRGIYSNAYFLQTN